MEEWHDIPDYAGLYKINRDGQILNCKKLKRPSKVDGRIQNWRMLKQYFNKRTGYLHVILSKNSIERIHTIHRLLATVFIPNPYNYKFVNHKDENKINNSLNNLEWCTKAYNNTYGSRAGRKVVRIATSGERVHYLTAREASLENQCCVKGIRACANHKLKTCHGYKWEWEE